MSSTLTARTELVPLPGHQLHAVQPVMPASRSAASPARTACKEAVVDPISASTKLDTFPLKSTSKTAAVGMGAPDARTVLGRVNLNVASNATSIAGGLHKRPTQRPAKTIPRPAAAPDVFGPAPSAQPQSLLGKRARGDPAATSLAAASLSKRQRAEATAIAAQSHREEQDRWLQKWLKVFPTLVFHFEIGAEEGAGRGLRQRVLGMGAVSTNHLTQSRLTPRKLINSSRIECHTLLSRMLHLRRRRSVPVREHTAAPRAIILSSIRPELLILSTRRGRSTSKYGP